MNCDCMRHLWEWSQCPFALECLDEIGYTWYYRLVRDENGKVTGYMQVLEKCR